MCVVDRDGRITLWNDALERILGCPRDRALGRSLSGAVPVLGETDLPRAIKDTLSDRTARTLPLVRLPSATDPRVLQVKILPVVDGVALLWHDITERTQAEQELKRTASGSRSRRKGPTTACGSGTFGRRSSPCPDAVVGDDGAPPAARRRSPIPEAWLERVHAGRHRRVSNRRSTRISPGSQRSSSISTGSGMRMARYRRFLCRGLALKGAGRRSDRIAGSLTDTTEQTIAQERLRSVGVVDSLTGLCNRDVFVEGLGRRLEEVKRRGASAAVSRCSISISIASRS